MKASGLLLVVCAVGLVLSWLPGRGSMRAQEFRAPAPALLRSPFAGAGSCAASACHNANIANEPTGSEFTIWATRDPHAKGYETLFEPRSVRIQKNLSNATKANEDRRCLKCHVGPDFDEYVDKQIPYFRTDGVSCESCHGAAGQWLTAHHAPSWRDKTPAQKQGLGMKDTQSILGRVQLCAACHVGAPGMDVDHELIAAGHPPLRFEFSAFHAGMPRHWSDAKDRDPATSKRGQRDFEYRGWLTGQLVVAHAALELLANRAGDARKPWPEFAEHDCASCHHDLHADQRAEKRDALPGSTWGLAMTPHVLQAMRADANRIGDLQRALDKGWPQRGIIALKARQAAQPLKPLLQRIDLSIPADAVLREILAKASRKPLRGWDETAQVGLALAALQRYENDGAVSFAPERRRAIQDFARGLAFPGSYDNPGSVDPPAVRKRLIEFKSKEGR